ncbi:MAG: hypothetical protein ABI949_01680 [Ilumatobacteraceae bacterium]
MSNASEMSPPADYSNLTTPVLGDVAALLKFSTGVIAGLRNDDGVYCYDRSFESTVNRGRSLRYTLMVAIGHQRASAAGYDVSVSADALASRVLEQQHELSPGDRGLLLWLLSRLGDDRAQALAEDMRSIDATALLGLAGMEIGWLVSGASAAVAAGLDVEPLMQSMVDVLRSRRSANSPLFRQTGNDSGRALYPNFATQIYSVLALAMHGATANDATSIRQARELADLLIDLRHPDGGWPWIFHTAKASVVERYQVYSVHQDAMAPMALFELADATGEIGYARAGVEGLPWCFGHNELQFNFYDGANRFAHRAIKRRGWADRAELWSNTALALSHTTKRLTLGAPEVNTTCRPYHLGWILEAWAGRERNIELIVLP